jgi:hypothetical protein
MLTDSKSLNDEIFDLILTRALKEDCEREVAMYERMANESKPHVFSEKFEKGIAKISKGLQRKEHTAKFKKVAPKLATVATIMIMVTALATNPAIAAFFGRIFVQIADDTARHEFVGDVEITPETFNSELRPSFIPQGYRIQSVWYGYSGVVVEYANEENEIIIVRYGIADDSAVFVNSEHSIQRVVLVNGREAFFYESTDEDFSSNLVWNYGGYAFVILAQISLDEFVQIAESIKIS